MNGRSMSVESRRATPASNEMTLNRHVGGDLYSLESVQLPPIKDDDSVDLPPAVRKAMDRRKETIHESLARTGLMREVLRAYLTCIS
jgi:hypothetical protein